MKLHKTTLSAALASMTGLASMTALASLTACGAGGNHCDATGVFEVTEILVSARGEGEILRLDITEGEVVTAGQAIGLIDTTSLHLRRKELEGSFRAATSRRANLDLQLAPLTRQLATARAEQSRFEGLVRNAAATQKQLDDITAQVALLEEEIAARRRLLTDSNASLDGEIEAMRARLEQVDDQIARSEIVAPTNGTVVAKYAQAGELAPRGRALFRVADLEQIFLRAYLTAEQTTRIRLRQPVRVWADWGESDRREFAGTVSWISDRAEFTPKTIQTRDERANLVYAVRIAVDNPDGVIKTGMYGEVKFEATN